MSQEFTDRINAFLSDAKGVIHVGAHIGQEAPIYAKYGLPVAWIEPLPGPFEILQARIAQYPNQKAYQYLVTDKDGCNYEFLVANNAGQSSSVLPFSLHRRMWPTVEYIGWLPLTSATLATIVEWENINLDDYDTLILDVQGAELMVLKGAESILHRIKYIRAETGDVEFYAGGATVQSLDKFLFERWFERMEMHKAVSDPDIGMSLEVLWKNLEPMR
jgi:FkbM family methyltransferase